MGRQLRRVPLDFEWPLNKVWSGFHNSHPYGDACPDCKNSRGTSTGYSRFANRLADQWYGFEGEYDPVEDGKTPFTWNHPAVWAFAVRQVEQNPSFYGQGFLAKWANANRLAKLHNTRMSCFLNQEDVDALIEAGRLHGLTGETWDADARKWVHPDPRPVVTAEQVNNWSIGGVGHDAINQWVVVRSRCARAGVDERCSTCKGHAVIWPSKRAKKAYESWEASEPPIGEGYQMWETVSAGSPISPVFAEPEALAAYLVKRAWGTDGGTSYDQWMRFIVGKGWAPSAAGFRGGAIKSGVQFVAGEDHVDRGHTR